MAAAAVRSAGEEFLASWLAKDRSKHGHFYTTRIPKQAIYGSLIHIPITHWLLKGSRYLFRGRTSPTSRFLAILFGLLVVAPVQKIFFFVAGAIIAGARTFHQVRATVRAGLFPVMKVVLLVSPIAVAFASNFLPERAWPKFFDIVDLAINTYGNAHVKKKRLAALRRRFFDNPVVKNAAEDESNAGSIAMPTTLRPNYPPIPRGNLVVGQGDVMLDATPFFMPTPIQPIYPPNAPGDSVVGQADVVLSAGQIVLPAPLRPYRGPSYSSDSAAEDEETESDASPIITPSPVLPYHRPNYSNNSVAEEEETEPGTVLTRRPSPQPLFYRLNRSSGLVVEREGAGSDTGQPGAAAAAAEAVTARRHYNAGMWQTLDTTDNSSDSDREEKGMGSEIDSDTSSDLPIRWRYRRYKRGRRLGDRKARRIPRKDESSDSERT
ncbi:hypothetical protein K432DRAFT_443443 [Lepidopterella palustris CBS 459.81]|uniref:Uncharacterized protein n=1 Tax=Lepidopterella palustris CBS 459.81 TaxID=1314670 RepID=A0A8E2JEZ0_9PEZI|nr:hypothetical protein K432DRAFT_443443 [Lepidopterella palustris CBS 459.81]